MHKIIDNLFQIIPHLNNDFLLLISYAATCVRSPRSVVGLACTTTTQSIWFSALVSIIVLTNTTVISFCGQLQTTNNILYSSTCFTKTFDISARNFSVVLGIGIDCGNKRVSAYMNVIYLCCLSLLGIQVWCSSNN